MCSTNPSEHWPRNLANSAGKNQQVKVKGQKAKVKKVVSGQLAVEKSSVGCMPRAINAARYTPPTNVPKDLAETGSRLALDFSVTYLRLAYVMPPLTVKTPAGMLP